MAAHAKLKTIEQAKGTAAKQREIQRQVAKAEKAAPEEKKPKAMQAGAREYPVPPLPKQHQAKPGIEAKLDPQPMYDAPYWRGSGKLEGKVAIVTGGDSGIGRAIAVLYAREGCDVAILHLDEAEDAAETERAVKEEGRRALVIAGDVRNREFCRKAVAQVVEHFGRLDILINNAAFQIHATRFEDLTEAHFDQTLKTNLYGYFFMAQAAVPHMEPGSAIVNTGSVTGIRGSEHLIDYSMTKGGIHAFTKALSSNLLPRGIRVNAVAPGPVWTPLNPSDSEADEVAQFGAQAPMGRPAQPEEISPAFVFLASPQCSSYITGEVLPIIGGYG